jgi:hypothetical protein
LSKTFLEVFHEIKSDILDFARETLIGLEKDFYDVIVSDCDIPLNNIFSTIYYVIQAEILFNLIVTLYIFVIPLLVHHCLSDLGIYFRILDYRDSG